jgi:hypothetical protein
MAPNLPPRNDVNAFVGRAAHDLGLAGLLGGTLFGRLALHPAVTEISDKRERGRVVNAAWRRYGAVNGLSLAAVTAGWAAARAGDAAPKRLTAREELLAKAKDALTGTVALTGLATAVQGIRFSRSAPGGGVPLEDGDHTAPEASASSAKTKRALNGLGIATLVGEVGLVAVNAALAQENHRRPALRRRVRRLRS